MPNLPADLDAEVLGHARKRALRLSSHLKNRSVTIRRMWLRNYPGVDPFLPVASQLANAPGGEGTNPGKYGLAFRTHLLSLWAAGGGASTPQKKNPYAVDREAHSTGLLPRSEIAQLLALPSSGSRTNRMVSDAVGHLTSDASFDPVPYPDVSKYDRHGGERHPLLTAENLPSPDPRVTGWTIQLLDDLGTGQPYVDPGDAAVRIKGLREQVGDDDAKRAELKKVIAERDSLPAWLEGVDLDELKAPERHHYFTLPPELFTNGWLSTLPIPALHVWLWMLSWRYSGRDSYIDQQPWEAFRHLDGFAINNDTYSQAVRVLSTWGLVEAEKNRHGIKTVYELSIIPDAVVTTVAPLARPPSTRMSEKEWNTWLEQDTDRRMPARSKRHPLGEAKESA